jgi:predicted methyltransferase
VLAALGRVRGLGRAARRGGRLFDYIAEARQAYKAKTAEREILHQAALRKAATREEVELLNEHLRRDLERLASDRGRKIAEIRGEAR